MPLSHRRVAGAGVRALQLLGCVGLLALVSCGKDAKTAAGPKSPSTVPGERNPEPCQPGTVCQCEDGVDNDNDGLVDWHFDLGCSARNDASEGGAPTGTVESGWTVFEPSSATQIIYVSAEGNDDWSGLVATPSGSDGPKRSFNSAIDAMRPGQADWVLLRRGDTFEGSVSLKQSGRSQSEPVVIGSYGTETTRPIIQGGIYLNDGPKQDFAILHVQLNDGFSAAVAASNVIIEGCFFQGAAGITATGAEARHSNWRIRRNVLSRSNDNGFYFHAVAGLLIEENVLYRPSMVTAGNHGIYITRGGSTDVVTRGNLMYMGKPQGNAIMQRPGGLSEGNVVGGAGWNAISFGACNDGEGGGCQPAVTAVARGNLIVERRPELGCGIGWDEPYVSSAQASGNLFADEPQGELCTRVESQPFVTEEGTVVLGTPADPERPGTLLGAYNSVQGGEATTDAFFENAVQQRKFVYRPEFAASGVIEYARSLAPQTQ